VLVLLQISEVLLESGIMSYLEGLDDNGKGGTEQHDLAVLWMKPKQLFYNWGELRRQKLVGLIHDKGLAGGQISHSLAGQIKYSSWRSDNDMDWVAQSNDIVLQPGTARRHHDIDAEVLSKRLANLRSLESQLSGRDEYEGLCFGDLGVYALECGDNECGGLSGAVLRSRKDVAAGECYWNCLFLDW
jgi:hypothetical protein